MSVPCYGREEQTAGSTMQLTFDADIESFRAEFVAFLDEHLPTAIEATLSRAIRTTTVLSAFSLQLVDTTRPSRIRRQTACASSELREPRRRAAGTQPCPGLPSEFP